MRFLPQRINWEPTYFVRVKGLLLLGPSAGMPPVLRPAWPTCQHSPRRLGKNLPRARLGHKIFLLTLLRPLPRLL